MIGRGPCSSPQGSAARTSLASRALASRLLLCLPLLASACRSAPLADPPLRALHEIPFAPPRPGPYADERQAFEAALAVYRGHGFEDEVSLVLAEDVVLPYAAAPDVYTWRFLGDGPAGRAHVARVSREFYGGRLDGWERGFRSRAAATEALHAFMTTLLGHEIAHVLAARRGVSAFATDPWLEETRAIRFEWAVLRELIARNALPERYLDSAIAFNLALLAAAPPGLVAGLPNDEEARRARFNAGYYHVASGDIAGHEREASETLALYSLVRIEIAQHQTPWESLASLLTARPPDPTPMATAARELLADPALGLERVDPARLSAALHGSEGAATVQATVVEADAATAPRIQLELRLTLDKPVPPGRRAPVALVLGRANREHSDTVCDIEAEHPVLRCRAVVSGEVADLQRELRRAFLRALSFYVRWAEVIANVIAGKADPERATPADAEEVP